MDYYYVTDKELRERQQEIFRSFLDIANNHKVPIVMHVRDCEKKAVNIIEDYDDIPYFVNTLLNLEGTKIAYIIKEIGKNNYKVSLRSIKGYDVSKVAQKFGGGGHIQASGITIGCRLKEFQEQLLFECLKETNKVEDNDVW